MLPTEMQRILLLVGLAACGYFLILKWSQDYGQAVDTVAFAEPAAEVLPDASTAPSIAAAAPGDVAPTATSGDAPDDSLLAPAAPAGISAPGTGTSFQPRSWA